MQKEKANNIFKISHFWKQFLSLSILLGLTFLTDTPSRASEHFSEQISFDILPGDGAFLALSQDQHLSQNLFDSNLPKPIPDQPEESVEEENLEKEETSDDNRVAVSKFSVCLRQQITEIQSVQFYQSVQNRKNIPFFILFQNWKSFLA